MGAKLRTISGLLALLAGFFTACSGGNGDEPENQFLMFLDTSALSTAEFRFVKGRCLGKLSISAKTEPALAAVEVFARHVIEPIALDGASPANDSALVNLVPRPPLAGNLSQWLENTDDGVDGPYLITSNAFAWINGAAGPFEDNGFEAVVVENYDEQVEGWTLELTVVNMASAQGAALAFGQANWDTGAEIAP